MDERLNQAIEKLRELSAAQKRTLLRKTTNAESEAVTMAHSGDMRRLQFELSEPSRAAEEARDTEAWRDAAVAHARLKSLLLVLLGDDEAAR